MKKLYDAISEIDSRNIEIALAEGSVKRRAPMWKKWTAAAACFAVIAVGCAILLNVPISGGSYTVDLGGGESLTFEKSTTGAGNFKLDYDMIGRNLEPDEIDVLFGSLPVSAYGMFSVDDGRLFGVEGTIGNANLIVLEKGMAPDIVLVGNDSVAMNMIDGVPVSAGYFLTDPNSKGIRTFICFAGFTFGDVTVYVDIAGTEDEREAVSLELVDAVRGLVANGEIALSRIRK